MTTDETRDELARMDGWTRICGVPGMLKEDGDFHLKWKLRHHEQWDHPMPPTLDGANAAVPEGWNWYRQIGPQNVCWEGRNDTYHHILRSHLRILVPDTGNPMDDLYALALACRRAMEATNGKA